MEMKFREHKHRHMKMVADQLQQREETQELRLPEGMPDIGRILGCWGQAVIRGKEWRTDSISCNGGVMVWVLYEAEDGVQCESLETWIPFQHKWEFTDTQRDGAICVVPKITHMDARSTSARKIMIRVNVSTWGRAMVAEDTLVYQPEEIPQDVQLLRRAYPMELPMECGEKMIPIDQTVIPPENMPVVEKILRLELNPQIHEKKIMASRLVFRGTCKMHILYQNADRLHTWDAEIGFSQYADLDRDYTTAADAQILPVLTNLETEIVDGGVLLRASLAAQYTLYDRVMLELTEDAYSPIRGVTPHSLELKMPARLDCWTQPFKTAVQIHKDVDRIIDTAYMADHPRSNQTEDGKVEIQGLMQILYYDLQNNKQTTTLKYGQFVPVSFDDATLLDCRINPQGAVHRSEDSLNITLTQEWELDASAHGGRGMQMLSGLDLAEEERPDPHRPSLLLRRCENMKLWDLAKQCGSTVEAIRQANGLEDEPESGRMLLIPIA